MDEVLFYNVLLISWFILSVAVFITLFFIAAPYGRHVRKGWGISLNSRLGWLVMEAPAAIVFTVFYFISGNQLSPVNIVFLILWQSHYIHRSFIYPFSLSNNAKQIPISVIASGFFFNILNGYLNGRYLFTFSGGYNISWLWDPRFIIGLILFITGYMINRKSDKILRNLRRDNEAEYQIPEGGLFNEISCPNYFGELIIWSGWALATWSISGLAFAFWTAANLIPRARAHHQWYRKSFSGYPAMRKAFIPKLW